MGESAVDVGVNQSITSFLTEEMIDAAMSERLSMLEKRTIPTYGRRVSNDHNYCIDGVEDGYDYEEDDEDSSDSDFPGASVISSDDIDENKEASIILDDKKNNSDVSLSIEVLNDDGIIVDSQKKLEEEIQNNSYQNVEVVVASEKKQDVGKKDSNQDCGVILVPEKERCNDYSDVTNVKNSLSVKTLEKTQSENKKEINNVNLYNDVNLNRLIVNEPEKECGKNDEIILRGILDYDKNQKYNASNDVNKSNLILIMSSDSMMNSNRSTVVQKNIDSVGERKQGFSVKPISNLLKNDLIVDDKSVKILKCIEGQIEMLSGAKPKSVNDFISKPLLANSSVSNFEGLSVVDSESIPEKNLEKIRKVNSLDKFLIGQDNPKTRRENCYKEDYITVVKESTSLKTSDGNICNKTLQCGLDKNSSLNSEKVENFNVNESISSNKLTNSNLELPVVERTLISSIAMDSETSSTISHQCNNADKNVVEVNSGTENSAERFDSVNELRIPNETVTSNYVSSNLPSKSSVTIKPTSNPSFQRRQILPKINYRYHMKDKFIISDKLPKNVTASKKNNENMYILPDKSSAQPVLLVSPDTNITSNNVVTTTTMNLVTTNTDRSSAQPVLLVSPDTNITSNNVVTTTTMSLVTTSTNNLVTTTSSKNLLITPSSQSGVGFHPHHNPVTIKYMTNKVVSTNESLGLPKAIGSNPSENSLSVTVKDKCITGKTWEKVDRFTLSNETSQQKLEEFSIKSLKAQLLDREVPLYKPPDCCEFYTCLDCNDRFVLESSLRNHRFRKSVLIKYWCRTCSCSLNMYNRCMFLAHIRSHGQLVKNLDMSSLSVEPLPRSLIKFRTNEENSCNIMQNSSGSTANQSVVNATPILISVNASNDNSKQPKITKNLKKSIPRNFINNTSSHGKSVLNNLSLCSKVLPKVVSSDVDQSKNLEKEIDVQLHDDGEDDDYDDDYSIDNCDDSEDVNHGGDSEVAEVGDSIQIVCNRNSISAATSEKNYSNPVAEKNIGLSVITSGQDIFQSNGISVDLSSSIPKPTEKLKSDKQSDLTNKAKSVKKRQCSECGEHITAKRSLRKHLQNGNRPGDPSLKCNMCRMILPTNCALKMHLRIHMKLKPFRCPECAIEFHIYDRFIMHLKYTCCHLAKCVRYVCNLCGNMQLSLAALEQHLLMRHVRPIFKCGNCPVAFVSLKAVAKHKAKAHPGRIVQTHCYQQCRLCPEKLIPKKKFLEHLKGHMNDKVCIYAYQCPKCKNTFFQRTELIYHRMQCDFKEGINKSVLKSPTISPTDENNVSAVTVNLIDNGEDDEEEVILPLKKRKIVGDDEIQEVEDEQDPLSLEGFQAEEEPLSEPLIELCVVCKKENVVILPGKNKSSQSLCCKKCVRPCGALLAPKSSKNVSENKSKLQAAKLKCYKCKICESDNPMDLKLTYEHFKTYHKELEGQSINEWLIIENRTQQFKRSNTITTAETIKEKYNKKRKIPISMLPELIPENEKSDVNEDVSMLIASERRKQKRFIKPKHKATEVKSFESGQIITIEDVKPELNCSKCDFTASSKEELRDHVTCHRTDPNALQCLECGECFVVLPSLEKHLIINHRISDVDSYIDSNKQYIDGSSEKKGCTEEGQGKESENDFTCRVCHEIFESKTVLDKHFRSHGMAFLFKNSLL